LRSPGRRLLQVRHRQRSRHHQPGSPSCRVNICCTSIPATDTSRKNTFTFVSPASFSKEPARVDFRRAMSTARVLAQEADGAARGRSRELPLLCVFKMEVSASMRSRVVRRAMRLASTEIDIFLRIRTSVDELRNYFEPAAFSCFHSRLMDPPVGSCDHFAAKSSKPLIMRAMSAADIFVSGIMSCFSHRDWAA